MPETTYCGYSGMSVDCGCDVHRAMVLLHPEHPDVIEGRVQIVGWMAEHPGVNPATGRALAHPDDYLVEVYGTGATAEELEWIGVLV